MTKIPRLFELLKETNKTQKQLAEYIGASQGNISDWKSGKATPTAEKLCAIADFFSVTVDYLLGRTPPISYAPTLSDTEQELVELFRSLSSEQAEMLLLTARTAAAQNDRKAAQKEDV